MKLESYFIDELIDLRVAARAEKNWLLSDNIRDYLDTRHVFVFDTADSQIIYHRKDGTREDIIKELKEEARAERLFESWLFSVNAAAQLQGVQLG